MSTPSTHSASPEGSDTAATLRNVAVIGAGPAGFYAAEALLKQDEVPCRIDIFNRFPPPFGLVRDGVAPDHQPIKSVTRIYEKILGHERVRYFGNVDLGTDITVDDLRSMYDHIVYAVGAQADRRLGIDGEDLEGSWAATQFVGWYNGRPDFKGLSFDLSCEDVVVVGNGNVAMDVARILVLPWEELAKTDIADHALEPLKQSKVRRVTLLGRRGPAQAAFTNPELKEFGKIDGVVVDVRQEDLELDPQSQAALEGDRARTRNMKTLLEYAEGGTTGDSPRQDRTVRFRFLTSPTEILGTDGRVEGVRIERNVLVEQEDGSMRPKGTGTTEVLPAGLVLRSVGYRGNPVPGVPFEPRRGIIPNHEGRVVDADGAAVPGEFVVGWAKRGPSGVIGTNKSDANATVTHMVQDLKDGVVAPGSRSGSPDPGALLDQRGVRWISYDDWQTLDRHEVDAGQGQGRPRVKVCDVEQMLSVIGK